MKLLEIMNARQVIGEIAHQATNVKLAYKLAKFMSVTQPDYDFYSKAYKENVEKFEGKITENGLEFTKEKAELFNAAIQEVQETEAVDPEIRFDLSDFSANMQVSTQQIYLLLPFIKDAE